MPKIPTFSPASEGGVWHADKDGRLEQVVKPPKNPEPIDDDGEAAPAEASAAETPPAAGKRRGPSPAAAPANEEPA